MSIIIPPSLGNSDIIDDSLAEDLKPYSVWTTIKQFQLGLSFFPVKSIFTETFADYLLDKTIEGIKLTDHPYLRGIKRLIDDDDKSIIIKFEHDTQDFVLKVTPEGLVLHKSSILNVESFISFCAFAQKYIAAILYNDKQEINEPVELIHKNTYQVVFRIHQLFRVESTKDTPAKPATNEDVIRNLFGLSKEGTDQQERFFSFLPYQVVNRHDLKFSLDWNFPGVAGEQKKRNVWLNLQAPVNEDRKLLWAEWVYASDDEDTNPCDMWCDWVMPVNIFWKQAILEKLLSKIFGGLAVRATTQ